MGNQSERTALGAFLDPLADKVLNLGALIAMLNSDTMNSISWTFSILLDIVVKTAVIIAVGLTLTRIVKLIRFGWKQGIIAATKIRRQTDPIIVCLTHSQRLLFYENPCRIRQGLESETSIFTLFVFIDFL